MDPVTVVGATASIIGIAHVTASLLTLASRYISSVRSAPKEIEELLRSINDFSLYLQELRKHVEAHANLPSLGRLNADNGSFKTCMAELETFRDRLDNMKRLTWPFKASEVTKFISTLDAYKTLFSGALGLDHLSLSQDIGNVVRAEAAKQDAFRESELSRRREKELLRSGKDGDRSASFSWLFSGSTSVRHVEISGRREVGTGDWFLELPEFREFVAVKPEASMLWVHGLPGVGKSFITSSVIDHLKDLSSSSVGSVTAYIYFNSQDKALWDQKKVIASLVKQLACLAEPVPPEIDALHHRTRLEGGLPTLEVLYSTLVVFLTSFPRIFLVFDALDECDTDDRLQRKLVTLFKRMKTDGFNVFLTSRPYTGDVELLLRGIATVQVQANEQDMRVYIDKRILEYPHAERLLQRIQCDNVASKIIASSQGMFLLASFYTKEVVECIRASDMKIALERLSEQTTEHSVAPLFSVYRRAMKIINSHPNNHRNLAIGILSWLLKAKRTLSVKELQVAVSIEREKYRLEYNDLPDREMMLRVCSSLVKIDENSNEVRFVHHTAQEFLLKEAMFEFGTAEQTIVAACSTYLSFEAFSSGACSSYEACVSLKRAHPFLDYAAQNLSAHVKNCDEKLTEDVLRRFLERQGCLDLYRQISSMDASKGHGFDSCGRGMMPLHIASAIGHCTLVRSLMETGSDIWAVDGAKRIPLHYATEEGDEGVMRILLGLDKQSAGDALIKVMRRGLQAVTRSLVDKETPTDTERARRGRREAIIKLLGGCISVRDHEGETPLHLAAASGNEQAVRLLVQEGADVSAKSTKRGETALIIAARKHHWDLVRMLWQKGGDITAADRHGDTMLHWATRAGDLEMVRLLVTKGRLNVSTPNRRGAVALHFAARGGLEDVVKLLLSEGADVSVLDSDGRAPLHYAAQGGSREVVRCLLLNGSPITITPEGTSPLHYAAGAGRQQVFEEFIAHGADITLRDKQGRSALHWAVDGKNSEIVRILLENGLDTSLVNSEGMTALHCAVSSYPLVRQLIEGGADISIKDNHGRTALHLAVIAEDHKVVELLILGGADVSALDRRGRTALHAARYYRNVELLISNGADILALDNNGETLLHHAAGLGRVKIVEVLVSKGADVSILDKDGRTALHHAAGCRRSEDALKVCRILTRAGVDITALDNDGQTAEEIATSCNNEDFVMLLTGLVV